jgi:hypothetical protein
MAFGSGFSLGSVLYAKFKRRQAEACPTKTGALFLNALLESMACLRFSTSAAELLQLFWCVQRCLRRFQFHTKEARFARKITHRLARV